MRCLWALLSLAWQVDTFAKNVGSNPCDSELAIDGGFECEPIANGSDVWCCRGEKLFTVPRNLTQSNNKSNTMTLKLRRAGIKVLHKDSLTPYAGILEELYLQKVPDFYFFEPGIFQNTTQLQTIYVSDAPNLTFVHDDVFNVYLPRLRVISILRAALHAVPYLGELRIGMIPLEMIDFENNKIEGIGTNRIKIKSEELRLDNNKITIVNSSAFNGSEIGMLSFKKNIRLTSIHANAFAGLKLIRDLDLSETSITALPTKGLEQLKVLIVNGTTTLKVLPSVYKFLKLTRAVMTYPNHCCAFKLPQIQDPETYKGFVQKSSKSWGNKCPSQLSSLRSNVSGTIRKNATVRRRSRVGCGSIVMSKFHKLEDVVCLPKPDAFNPCEDIMGSWELRITVWFVALLSIVGNLAVLIVLISTKAEMTVPKFLMCNLAWADLCMGIYLILIAGMDAHSLGEYFNYAIDWQRGLGCQVAGFLTVFSTELSIFTLTVITYERWYTISHAIHLNRRLNLKTSAIIMFVGWIYACIMAGLPLADISNYTQTSICLPMANRNTTDFLYLVTLLVFTGVAFLAIVACYGHMYSSVRGSREEAAPMARFDMRVAKRMALLVFVDFLCWAPIVFFAVTALVWKSLINLAQTKILLVFVYPLNSCANPYLYAILTHQYRRDLYTLLARYGICRDKATRYKRGTSGPLAGARASNRGASGRRTAAAGNQQRTSSLLTTAIVTSRDHLAHDQDKTPNNCIAPQSVVTDCQSVV